MRRYWYHIDYSKVEELEPLILVPPFKTTLDTIPLGDIDFRGFPDDLIKEILKRRHRVRAKESFIKKNFIHRGALRQKSSKQNRKFFYNKKFRFIYYFWAFYKKIDAILYLFKFYCALFGDKKFRKLVRKIASIPLFVYFRIWIRFLLYYLISFPIKNFYYLYRFLRSSIKKLWFPYKVYFIIKMETKGPILMDTFWSFYQRKVSKKTKKILHIYYAMYSVPYYQFFKSWREFRSVLKEYRLLFKVEFNDIYTYLIRISFVTVVVEIYYIMYHIIFFFYPFVIHTIFLIPFYFFSKAYIAPFVENFWILILLNLILVSLCVYIIMILSSVEIAKRYLFKTIREPVDWRTLDIISKIAVVFNILNRFYFEKKGFNKHTRARAYFKAFQLHEINLWQKHRFQKKNVKYGAEDEKRGSSYFKKQKIYPHLLPRSWGQYGKLIYFKQKFCFYLYRNIFAGAAVLNFIDRKNLGLGRVPFFTTKRHLSFLEFFLFFYSLFLFLILNRSIFFVQNFEFLGLKIFLKKFIFFTFLTFLLGVLLPITIKVWFNFFFATDTCNFFIKFVHLMLYHPFCFFFGLFLVFFVCFYYTYKKYYTIISHVQTFHIFLVEKLDIIFYLCFFTILLKLLCVFILYIIFFYGFSDVLIEHSYCLSSVKNVIYDIVKK